MRPDALIALAERRRRIIASRRAIFALLTMQSTATAIIVLPMIELPIKVGLAAFAIGLAFAVSRGVAWLCRGYLGDMAVRTLLAQEARSLTSWHRFLDGEHKAISEHRRWTQMLLERAQHWHGGSGWC